MNKVIQHLVSTIALLVSFGLMGELQANTTPTNNSKPSISGFLNADGTLNIPAGFSGSLDVAGFSLEMDECEGVIATPAIITSSWGPLGSGIDNVCHALVIDGNGDLIVGGNFSQVGGQTANKIAKWDGSSWSALGTGFNFACYALAIDGNGNLYAGGNFSQAGGQPAGCVAKWDGSSWSPLGSGLNRACYALAIDGNGDLYAGGEFFTAGGQPASSIAKWDGSGWSALGSGLSYFGLETYCYALVIDGNGDLIVGGDFFFAGGMAGPFIAKWDGSSWSSLGSGLTGICYALAIDGNGDLYAGGQFNQAGGQPANNIAKWNGSSWSALGAGLGNYCYAIAIDGNGDLYAGGDFNFAGGTFASNSVNNVAKWDGSSWSALGTGLSNDCNALVIDGNNDLIAGGSFPLAGGQTVNYIAKWTIPTPCNVEITSVDITDATCGEGSITINANCIICPSILYSIDGGASTQASSTFTGLAPGTYMPYVVSSNDPGCNDMSANETVGILVPDNSNPNMVCNSFTLSLTGASTTITPGQVDGGSTDNCGITSLSLDNNTFTCNTLGAQTVTLTGTDASGNSSSCNATITVVDNTTPTAVCANPTINLTNDGTTSVDAGLFDGGSSEVCSNGGGDSSIGISISVGGGLSFSASMTDFDCSDVGNTINVTLTVTGSNGESSTCTSMVTVADPNSFCCAPANAICNSTSVQLGANGMVSITPSAGGGGKSR